MAVVFLAVLALDLLVADAPRRAASRAVVESWLPVAVLGAAVALAVAAGLRAPALEEFRWNVSRLVAYTGWPLGLVAAAGFFLLWFRERRTAVGPLDTLTLFLALAAFVVLRHKHVADLYPWAMKRFLPQAVPLLALLAGVVADRIERGVRRPWNYLALLLLLALGMVPSAGKTGEAANSTEYDGLSAVLDTAAGRVPVDDVIVADHFRWGTPLSFIWGRQVLNGERVWNAPGPHAARRAGEFLAELERRGVRIWFLTSTDRGMDIFPPGLRDAALQWSSGPVTYREVAHHRNSTGFWMRDGTVEFRLYAWPELR